MADATEPQTTIGTAWTRLLALVPPRHQARALELALILHGEYAAGEVTAGEDGYRRGCSDGEQRGREAVKDGYADGWNRGYQAGLTHVLVHTGTPACTRQDRDPLLPQAEEPPPAS